MKFEAVPQCQAERGLCWCMGSGKLLDFNAWRPIDFMELKGPVYELLLKPRVHAADRFEVFNVLFSPTYPYHMPIGRQRAGYRSLLLSGCKDICAVALRMNSIVGLWGAVVPTTSAVVSTAETYTHITATLRSFINRDDANSRALIVHGLPKILTQIGQEGCRPSKASGRHDSTKNFES